MSIAALSGAKEGRSRLDLEQQIRAIESKLKTMENGGTLMPTVPPDFVSPLSRSAVRETAATPYSRPGGGRGYRGGHRGAHRPYNRGNRGYRRR